jgi:hypothetical protein
MYIFIVYLAMYSFILFSISLFISWYVFSIFKVSPDYFTAWFLFKSVISIHCRYVFWISLTRIVSIEYALMIMIILMIIVTHQLVPPINRLLGLRGMWFILHHSPWEVDPLSNQYHTSYRNHKFSRCLPKY